MAKLPAIGIKIKPPTSAKLLVNARVQARPKCITKLIKAAIKKVEAFTEYKIFVISLSAFQLGYLKSVFRL